MAQLLSITDPAEDAALIAARAYHQSRESGGYDTYVGKALRRLNLDSLVQDANVPVHLDADALAAWINERVKGATVARGASNYLVAEAVYRYTSSALSTRLYEAIEAGQLPWTVDDAAPEFSPVELCAKYGASGALPRARGEHREAIEAQRKALAVGFAQVADDEGLCGSFEAALGRAGLSKYLPDRDATVSVEVPGFGPVEVEVRLSRAGTIDPGTVRSRILQKLQLRIAEAIDVSKASGLPEGALAA